MTKNTFYFTLKVLFVLEILTFFVLTFCLYKNGYIRKLRLISKFMESTTGQQLIKLYIFCSISQEKKPTRILYEKYFSWKIISNQITDRTRKPLCHIILLITRKRAADWFALLWWECYLKKCLWQYFENIFELVEKMFVASFENSSATSSFKDHRTSTWFYRTWFYRTRYIEQNFSVPSFLTMKTLIQNLDLTNTAFNKFLIISNKNIGFLHKF